MHTALVNSSTCIEQYWRRGTLYHMKSILRCVHLCLYDGMGILSYFHRRYRQTTIKVWERIFDECRTDGFFGQPPPNNLLSNKCVSVYCLNLLNIKWFFDFSLWTQLLYYRRHQNVDNMNLTLFSDAICTVIPFTGPNEVSRNIEIALNFANKLQK